MNDRQYFHARQAALEEYQSKLAALDKVWVMLHKSAPPKQPPAPRKRQPTGDGGSPLITALEVLVGEMTETFNTAEIDMSLRKAHPELAEVSRSTVTHTLRRLSQVKDAPIEILEVGKGKRPTTYKRLSRGTKVALGIDPDDL